MASARDALFTRWIEHEGGLIRRKIAQERDTVDRTAAAERWWRSGRRIIEHIDIIGLGVSDFADRAYAEAGANLDYFEMASSAINQILGDYSLEIPKVVSSAVRPPIDRTLAAAQERFERARKDIEAKSDINRLRILAEQEDERIHDGVRRRSEIERVRLEEEEDAALLRFEKLPRWGLLSVLAWIATGDLRTAWRASQGRTLEEANLSILMRKKPPEQAQIYFENIGEAWTQQLAPSLSEGRISGSGSLASGGALGGVERVRVGLTFPPRDQPSSADGLMPWQRKGHACGLSPIGSEFAHEWTDWRELVFPTARVRALWPSQREVKPAAQTLEAPLLINNIGNPPQNPSRASPSVDLALEALNALYPNGLPLGLRADKRNQAVRQYCRGREPLPSNSSIERALRRFKPKT